MQNATVKMKRKICCCILQFALVILHCRRLIHTLSPLTTHHSSLTVGPMTAYENRSGISSQRAELLVKALQPFSKVDEALPGRLAQYIIEGEPAQVLGQLKGLVTGGAS